MLLNKSIIYIKGQLFGKRISNKAANKKPQVITALTRYDAMIGYLTNDRKQLKISSSSKSRIGRRKPTFSNSTSKTNHPEPLVLLLIERGTLLVDCICVTTETKRRP